MTSAQVVAKAKRLLGTKKMGHAGTLDPMATGLLVLLSGNATRLQSVFLESEKEYRGRILLGRSTDTDDVTGQTLETDAALAFWNSTSASSLEGRIRKAFSGTQLQRPPSYSAIHVDGKRSYDLARQGTVVELEPREVRIEFLHLQFESESVLSYEIRCSKGTYVRSLARDIGAYLSSCACLESICRTASTPFRLRDAVSLESLGEDFPASHFVEMSSLVSHLPSFALSDAEVRLLRSGIQAPLEKLPAVASEVAAVFGDDGGLVGLIEPERRTDRTAPWKLRCVFTADSSMERLRK